MTTVQVSQSSLVRLAACVAVVVFALGARADDNWPEFRGPRGDGSSDSTGLPLTWSETEHVVWKTPIHDRGWSSPVIWKNLIWVTTATDDGHQFYAVAVDARSGKIVHDIKLFEIAEPQGIQETNTYASPTPVVEEGRLYAHFGRYGTACVDTETGQILWDRRDLLIDHLRGPGSSPIVVGDLVFIHFDGVDLQFVVALDKRTGNTVWNKKRDVDWGTTDTDFMKGYATPIVIDVDGQKQLISPGAKAMIAYEPKTGAEIWRVRNPGFSPCGRPLYKQGLVLFTLGTPPDLWAVKPGRGDVTDSNIAWKVSKHIGAKSSPVVDGDLVFAISDGGVAACLDIKTGREHWAHRMPGECSASPLLADGRVYYFSEDGATTVIRPGEKYEELTVNHLDDGFMASAAVTGKSLILRTRTSLYRIEGGAGD